MNFTVVCRCNKVFDEEKSLEIKHNIDFLRMFLV